MKVTIEGPGQLVTVSVRPGQDNTGDNGDKFDITIKSDSQQFIVNGERVAPVNLKSIVDQHYVRRNSL